MLPGHPTGRGFRAEGPNRIVLDHRGRRPNPRPPLLGTTGANISDIVGGDKPEAQAVRVQSSPVPSYSISRPRVQYGALECTRTEGDSSRLKKANKQSKEVPVDLSAVKTSDYADGVTRKYDHYLHTSRQTTVIVASSAALSAPSDRTLQFSFPLQL